MKLALSLIASCLLTACVSDRSAHETGANGALSPALMASTQDADFRACTMEPQSIPSPTTLTCGDTKLQLTDQDRPFRELAAQDSCRLYTNSKHPGMKVLDCGSSAKVFASDGSFLSQCLDESSNTAAQRTAKEFSKSLRVNCYGAEAFLLNTKALDLDGVESSVYERDLAVFKEFTQIEQISLTPLRFDEVYGLSIDLRPLKYFGELKELYLYAVSNESLASMPPLPKLQYLKISPYFAKMKPLSNFKFLAVLPALKNLEIAAMSHSFAGLESLSLLESLKINMAKNTLVDLSTFPVLPRLKSLQFHEPAYLKSLKGLERNPGLQVVGWYDTHKQGQGSIYKNLEQLSAMEFAQLRFEIYADGCEAWVSGKTIGNPVTCIQSVL